MDVARLLRRAAGVEQTAAQIYDTLALRFPEDRLLQRFWQTMADQERRHGKKLGTWRQLLEHMPAAAGPDLSEFEKSIGELEEIAADLSGRAKAVKTADEAFSIALALESSELDVIYTSLLQASPISRFPDIAETRRAEIGRHHQALLEMVKARSSDEHNRQMAAILAVEE